MKLTEKKLREIIREELNSVNELAPVIATVARQAAMSAMADKVSEGLGTILKGVTENGLTPDPKDIVGLITNSADMHAADEDDEHTAEGFMGVVKGLTENAIGKIVGDAAKDAASDAIAKKIG